MDKREALLARIFTLIQGVPGFATYYRNRGELAPYTEDNTPNLPTLILLDGSEKPFIPVSRGRSPGIPPGCTIMEMNPQVFIILMPRENNQNDGIGEQLSSLRVELCKRILRDETLAALCGPNGEIEYRGCDTDLQTGSTIEGQMQLDFSFTYVFDPSAL